MDINFQNKLPKFEAPVSIKASRNAITEIVLLLIVAGLFYWFLLSPKMAEVKLKQAEADKFTEQKQSIQQDVATLKKLSEDLKESGDDLVHLDQALPLEERQVRTQLLLDQLIRSSGLFVGDISVNDPQETVVAGNKALLKNPFGVPRSLGMLTVNASVSGNFDQLLDLIKKLENYGRLMDISTLNLSAGSGGVLNMKLTFTMYYFGTSS